MRKQNFSFVAATVLVQLIAGGGCVTARNDRLARHDLSPLPSTTTSVVRETGLYQVRWVEGKERSGPIGGTERILRAGSQVGFTTTPAGDLFAIAGAETFPIAAPLPAGTRRVIWHGRHEEPSDLTKATGQVLGGAATVAVVGTALVGVAALHALDDDDCDDDYNYSGGLSKAERRELGEKERRQDRLYRVHRKD